MTLAALPWLWMPITILAASFQTLRNAAQRHLIRDLGTAGATLVRFLYGLPFAAVWLYVVREATQVSLPQPNAPFVGWVLAGALGQIAATALLLRTMQERNFAAGVAYSKTEIIQVAVFSIVLLGDPLSLGAGIAIVLASLGVVLISPQSGDVGLGGITRAWTSRAALFGLGSGAAFAVSAVGYRGAALAIGSSSVFLAAAYSLVWAQTLQSVMLGGWMAVTQPRALTAVAKGWRISVAAGFAGAAASAGWFTAMAMHPVAPVRTLGLVEVLFSYFVSRRVFREQLSAVEIAGLALLVLGVAVMTLAP
ncbi:MAG TPA: DMT family transporter [Candidatus Cybelea sp.]|nr:DMT family transporter [Candidatus Cybelea sp.]